MCECYEIGGPFIGADPDCPTHGIEAQLERERFQLHDEEREARIQALEERVRALEAMLRVPSSLTPSKSPEITSDDLGPIFENVKVR